MLLLHEPCPCTIAHKALQDDSQGKKKLLEGYFTSQKYKIYPRVSESIPIIPEKMGVKWRRFREGILQVTGLAKVPTSNAA
jgi:hypothetical protein